ncbi:MAG: hypothetical protein GC185_03665 [Alphaproteobacteria bacterium]|nr:hypothetical protein [Alphaproteobacteria bacterium]
MKLLSPGQEDFSLPVLAATADTLTRHFHAEFMHAFQSRRESDTQQRVYHAIVLTGQKTGAPPETVAKTLVDSGLRAGKESFPQAFVSAIENSKPAPSWNIAGLTPQQAELVAQWKENAPPPQKRPARQPPRRRRHRA